MAYTEQEQSNLDLVRSLYDKVLFPLDADAVDDHISQDYVQHSSLAEPGIDGLKAWLRMAKARPHLAQQTVHRLFADGDHVFAHTEVIRWPGDRGIAAMDLYRIADGRVAEHWDVLQEIPEHPVNPLPMF